MMTSLFPLQRYDVRAKSTYLIAFSPDRYGFILELDFLDYFQLMNY